MTSIPKEFEPEHIAAHAAPESQMYRDQVHSQEPMKSMLENNPEIYFVPPQRGSDWGNWEFRPGSYYDTTTGAKHPHWQDIALPQATRNIDQLRHDMLNWGYCKIEDALSAAQVEIVRERSTGPGRRRTPGGYRAENPERPEHQLLYQQRDAVLNCSSSSIHRSLKVGRWWSSW